MAAPVEPADRDRRRASRDRRKSLRDRRHFWPRFVPASGIGAVLRWITGPWSSANGVSWMRLLVLFFIVRWGMLTVYSIPSPSMEPTLHGEASFITRDRVAVNKLAFGPRYPFTAKRIFRTGTPKRWDIVVFNSSQPTDEGDILIKRVVGLPGEIVNIRSNGLFIDGKRVEPPVGIADKLNYTPGLEATPEDVKRLAINWAKMGLIPVDLLKNESPARIQLQHDLEKLAPAVRNVKVSELGPLGPTRLTKDIAPEGMVLIKEWWEDRLHRAGPSRYGVGESTESTLVPQGHYFVLGDNGPESVDSRVFGWVPHENLAGRAFAIVTPFGRARDLSGFLQDPRGRVIFFGILFIVFAWEIVPGFVVFSWRLRGAIPSLGLRRDDHVLVNRLLYGPRIPFTNLRFFWWRTPKPGEAVCFLMSRTSNAFDLYFGEVLSVDRASGLRVVVRGPGETARDLALTRRDIVGRARIVWGPRGRRGRIRPVGQVESPGGDRLH